VTATAPDAAVGDRSSFKNGRQFAAWLGPVPQQRSSGSARLFGISKRGDLYLRTLLIHGTRSALERVRDKQDPRSLWLGKMRQRRHPNIVAVALANKNARIAWSLLTSDSVYDVKLSVRATRKQILSEGSRVCRVPQSVASKPGPAIRCVLKLFSRALCVGRGASLSIAGLPQNYIMGGELRAAHQAYRPRSARRGSSAPNRAALARGPHLLLRQGCRSPADAPDPQRP
jgi:hypothetical protein